MVWVRRTYITKLRPGMVVTQRAACHRYTSCIPPIRFIQRKIFWPSVTTNTPIAPQRMFTRTRAVNCTPTAHYSFTLPHTFLAYNKNFCRHKFKLLLTHLHNLENKQKKICWHILLIFFDGHRVRAPRCRPYGFSDKLLWRYKCIYTIPTIYANNLTPNQQVHCKRHAGQVNITEKCFIISRRKVQMEFNFFFSFFRYQRAFEIWPKGYIMFNRKWVAYI